MTMARYRARIAYVVLLAFLITTVITFYLFHENIGPSLPIPLALPARQKSIALTQDESRLLKMQTYNYSRDTPLFFIGGMPRSGTTLLRVMLDAHPDIRCGGETRVIPRMLNMRNMWLKAPFEVERLLEAGVTSDVIDNAIGEFVLEIIVRHGRPAKRLCNKDPFTLKHATYIKGLFPNAQFLFVIRDGRAVAHSIVSRKVTISGFDYTSYRDSIIRWNSATESMYNQCQSLGDKICLPVHYEDLVLHPEKTMRKVMEFLKINWSETVLHHEDYVNKPGGGIELSKLERSTDQVVKPVNTETLSKWVGHIPKDVLDDMAKIAPMLAKLGYDPSANPPNYGDPDNFVKAKMKLIDNNKEHWKAEEAKLIKEREEMRKILMSQVIKSNKKDNKVKPI